MFSGIPSSIVSEATCMPLIRRSLFESSRSGGRTMKAPGALRQNDIVDFVSTLFDAYLAGRHAQSRRNPRGSAGRYFWAP